MLTHVKLTHRDSCKTFALKRIGLADWIDSETESPTIKEMWESDRFETVANPEVGCILIWRYAGGEDGYWHPHEIDVDGKIIFIKTYSYGHLGVYEKDNMVSDASYEQGQGVVLRLRRYDDLPKPSIILKLKNVKNKK